MMKPMKRMKTSRRHLCAGGCHTMTHDLYTRRDNKFRDPLYLCEECAKTIGAMAGLVEPVAETQETTAETIPVANGRDVTDIFTEAEVQPVPEAAEVEEPAETTAEPEPEVTDEPAEEPKEAAEPEKPKKTGGRGGKPKQKAAE